MWVYGLEEYMDKNDKTGTYDRVIVFQLLRSTITLVIKDGIISSKQKVYCENFYDNSIVKEERYAVDREKGAIDFFANKYIKLLQGNTSVNEIISADYENYPECLILQNEKLAVTKIEEVYEQVMEDFYKKRDEFEVTYARSLFKEHLRALFRINDVPRGDQIIRFYIPIIKDGKNHEAICDIHLSDYGISQTTEDCCIREEREPIIYFCRKYFELLRSNEPLEKIIKLDSGRTINYKPLLFGKNRRRFSK